MSLPRRRYTVIVKRGSKMRVGHGNSVRGAIAAARVKAGERFAYKLYEGQNQVECVATAPDVQGAMRWRERGK